MITNEKLDQRLKQIEATFTDTNATFSRLSIAELAEILGITIKFDTTNKVVTFLAMLSAYTNDSQLNLSFNAPSSSGKTFIPTEIADLFPPEDILELGHSSPTAFFHEVGSFDKERKAIVVNLSGKIIIFLDQPHSSLLERLRPILSHDKYEITSKITDRSEKHGLRTKTVIIRGYPVVIFCTAGLSIDEQEATRFLLLSPEVTDEKIRAALHEKLVKTSDQSGYTSILNDNKERNALKKRIIAIKQANISHVVIPEKEIVESMFLKRTPFLKPRHTRDIGRVVSLIKMSALLNLWDRERDGTSIKADGHDIKEGFAIWDQIQESQELNLPPYVYHVYKDIILPAWDAKQKLELDNNIEHLSAGLSRNEICTAYYNIHKTRIPDWQLRSQIIPMLETSGLIYQEPDSSDKRRMLIFLPVDKQDKEQHQNTVRSSEGYLIETPTTNES